MLSLFHVVGQFRGPVLPERAPDFRATTLNGEVISLSSYRGQPIILNFWATWCTPCRLEIPVFRRFLERNPDAVLISVTADGLSGDIAETVDELGIEWTVTTPNKTMSRAYGVSVYPTTVFIDEDGRITSTHAGLLTDPQLAWLAWNG